MSAYSVGIDVGGTFTDLIAIASDGRVEARKVLSTPQDQSDGVRHALQALGCAAADVAHIAHGTTVATNTLLERTGARVALCATEGAADLLELRRQERAGLYDLARHHPEPLVAPDRVIPVPERVEPQGIVKPLDAAGVRRVAQRAVECAPETIAIALLHAFHDGRHERALGAALRSLIAGVDVVLSSEVLPEIREYERTATTVAEAYLRPSRGHLSAARRRRARAGRLPTAVGHDLRRRHAPGGGRGRHGGGAGALGAGRRGPRCGVRRS